MEQDRAGGAPTETAPQPDSGLDRHQRSGAILRTAVTACRAYGREDMAERLDVLGGRLDASEVRVVVVGEFKKGKSSLVNALLNADVCAVDDDIATALPTVIRYGTTPSAHVVRAGSDGVPIHEAVALSAVSEYVTESPDGQQRPSDIGGVEVDIDRRILADGLVLVDTPGVGGLGAAHATATLGAISLADVAIFVTDASQEFTATEIEFLRRATELCPRVVCALTKTDLSPAWRTVWERDRAHLERIGLDCEVMAVSAPLRREALRRSDRVMNEESGYGSLVAYLAGGVLSETRRGHQDRVLADVVAVCDQFIDGFGRDLALLRDPDRATEVTARLEADKVAAEQRRSQAARWSTALSDGIADLTSDVDHDFRSRIRALISEIDDAIDAGDPADLWAEFEPWLTSRMSSEVVANHTLMTERAVELSTRVGELFGSDSQDTVRAALGAHGTASMADMGSRLDVKDPAKMGLEAGLLALRGGYGGVMMFTMLGSMVGLALGPIALGIGLVMGRKGIKDERKRRIGQRRQEAKSAARKYCDEVSFHVTKDTRDALRTIQRHLRDHFSARADEALRSANEALRTATEAIRSEVESRPQRIADLTAEIERVSALRRRAEELL
jgi:signal recognition particle receptor subunit beta